MEKSIAAGSREQCSVRAGHPARALEMAHKPERRLMAQTSATSASPHHFWFRDGTKMDDAEAPEYIANLSFHSYCRAKYSEHPSFPCGRVPDYMSTAQPDAGCCNYAMPR